MPFLPSVHYSPFPLKRTTFPPKLLITLKKQQQKKYYIPSPNSIFSSFLHASHYMFSPKIPIPISTLISYPHFLVLNILYVLKPSLASFFFRTASLNIPLNPFPIASAPSLNYRHLPPPM